MGSESKLEQSSSYLPGLHGLRFLGALVVFIGHLEQMKLGVGFPPTRWLPIPDKLGVVLFFVLSGYLITYLLFVERNKSGSISLRQFYLRRAFRIFPLYYLIVCGSLIYDGIGQHSVTSIVFHLSILPNYACIAPIEHGDLLVSSL